MASQATLTHFSLPGFPPYVIASLSLTGAGAVVQLIPSVEIYCSPEFLAPGTTSLPQALECQIPVDVIILPSMLTASQHRVHVFRLHDESLQ